MKSTKNNIKTEDNLEQEKYSCNAKQISDKKMEVNEQNKNPIKINKKEKRNSIKKKKILGFVLLFLACLVGWGAYFYHKCYGLISFDSFLFTCTQSMQGTDIGIIISNIIQILFPAIIIYLMCITILFVIKNIKNKKIWQFIQKNFISFTSVFLVISILALFFSMKMPQYIVYECTPSDFIEKEYINPKNQNIKPIEEKRNLIYIVAESLEASLFSKENGGLMDKTVIPELENIAKENVVFSNTDKLGGISKTFGATWSIAGLTASSLGIPLKLPMGLKFNSEKFLSNAYGLYDFLYDSGYQMQFLTGCDAEFGSVDKLMHSHGKFNEFDYNTAKKEGKIPEDYKVFWGFEDSKLYQFSKEKIGELYSNNKPFAMVIETIDTHMPHGYLCPNCPHDFDDQYSNVCHCASMQIEEFLNWAKEQPWYENTTIVITGDHQSMVSDYFNKKDDNKRTVFNCIINGAVPGSHMKNRQFGTIDMFPTILTAMGFEYDGSRLGLGTDLYSGEKTLFEQYGTDYVNKEFEKKSTFYDKNFLKK